MTDRADRLMTGTVAHGCGGTCPDQPSGSNDNQKEVPTMGLDMYLYAEKRTAKWDDDKDGTRPNAAMRDLADELGLPPDNAGEGNYNGITMRVQAGYWRKANAIHAWFVHHVQEGVDECQPHYVSRDDLVKLRTVCQSVLDKVNWSADGESVENADEMAKILPPQSGFFFGSTDIDRWFIEDVRHTIKVVDACLAAPETVTFEYVSSW